MPSFSAELVARAPLSPRVVGLTFVADTPFARSAGQYVVLTPTPGSSHAFSIASPFEEASPGRFEIAAALGTTAEPLLELPLGSRIRAEGPSGRLAFRGSGPSLFIATGTGVSPLRAIIKEQLAHGAESPLILLFGCRDAAEELWGAELRALSSGEPLFQYWPTQSQPAPGFTGLRGRVQAHVGRAIAELGSGLRAYVCGHAPMVKECSRLLLEGGVAEPDIHGEGY